MADTQFVSSTSSVSNSPDLSATQRQDTDLSPGSAETQLRFIQEIRTNRLALLWRATLISVLFFMWLTLLFAKDLETTLLDLILPVLVIAFSSYLTRRFLKHDAYQAATWAYALGVIFAVAFMMAPDTPLSRELVPAFGILIIFVIGMMMSVQSTFILLVVSYVLMILLPLLIMGDFIVTTTTLFFFALMALSTLLVTHVSGELYSIANWALESYRKERSTANKLHASRQDLERSLLKQRNLTVQIQNTNKELAEAREAAEIAKKFRGQFLANMSHELRTPLNAVIGFSETMLNFPQMYDRVELPTEYRRDLERIYASGKHLLGIINDILDLSKIDVGRLEIEIQPVDLDPIFKGLLSTAIGLVGPKPVELKRDLPEVLPMVVGDPLRIRQVLLNIYSNAAKFTQEGSITLSLTETDREVIIAITDTGPGISQDNLEVIFEVFQQGDSGRKQQRAGAGLGLAISRQLLGLMNGAIWVTSVVDKGSTFYISLPRFQPLGLEEEWTEVEESSSLV
ncbi:MAG: HAMP domain-containing histidine kinase [Chloroflexi bacterium]|nr:HAMP domain-containing histidine kinase [Chloroflexota bacterium]